jgi:hypothetical protein
VHEETALRFNREHALGIICIVVASAVLSVTPGFPKGQEGVNLTGPAFFPNIMAYLFMFLGVYQVVVGFLPATQARVRASNGTDAVEKKIVNKRTVLFIALLAGFTALFEPLGFFPTTLVFLFLLMLLFGLGVQKSILFSVIFVAVIYSLFGVLFTIGLPAGILGFLGI